MSNSFFYLFDIIEENTFFELCGVNLEIFKYDEGGYKKKVLKVELRVNRSEKTPILIKKISF